MAKSAILWLTSQAQTSGSLSRTGLGSVESVESVEPDRMHQSVMNRYNVLVRIPKSGPIPRWLGGCEPVTPVNVTVTASLPIECRRCTSTVD